MGTTPKLAIPYVEPADKLADFPAQDKAQAQKVEDLLSTAQPFASGGRTADYTFSTPSSDYVIGWDTFPDSHAQLPYTGGADRCDWTTNLAGLYVCVGWVTWAVSTTGACQLRITKNGKSSVVQNTYRGFNNYSPETQFVQRVLRCVAGDKIGLGARITGTTSQVMSGTIPNANGFNITRVGP